MHLIAAVLAVTIAVGRAVTAAPGDIPSVACDPRSEPVPQGQATRANVLFPPDPDAA